MKIFMRVQFSNILIEDEGLWYTVSLAKLFNEKSYAIWILEYYQILI